MFWNASSWVYKLLSAGSEERGELGVGSIPAAILPSCQDMITINNIDNYTNMNIIRC